MAGARTQGVTRTNPALFTGLAQIILQGGEASARRTERFGETIGSALAGLGGSIARSKERRASERQAESDRAFRRERAGVADSQWASEFAARQAESATDNARQDLALKSTLASRQADDERAKQEFQFRVDQKAREGELEALELLDRSIEAEIKSAMVGNDQAALDAALQKRIRLQGVIQSKAPAASSMIERPGEPGGLGQQAPVQQPRGLGRGKASQQLESGASMLPQIPTSDAAEMSRALQAEIARTNEELKQMPDKTPEQRAEIERLRRVRERAVTIHKANIVKVGAAEAAGRRASAQESIAMSGGDETDAKRAQLRMDAGFAPEEAERAAQGEIAQRQKVAKASESPKAAAAAITKIVGDFRKDEPYNASEREIGHRDRLAAIRAAPPVAAQALPEVNREVGAMILESFGVQGMTMAEAKKLLTAEWVRANPNASTADAQRFYAALSEAERIREANIAATRGQ